MKIKKKSQLVHPELQIGPNGRRYYNGSLSHMAGTLINIKQEKQIFRQLGKPQHLSSLSVEGINPFNPHGMEAIRRLVSRANEAGLVQLIRDDRNRVLGWKTTDAGRAHLEGLETEE